MKNDVVLQCFSCKTVRYLEHSLSQIFLLVPGIDVEEHKGVGLVIVELGSNEFEFPVSIVLCCCGLVIVELGSNGFEFPVSIVLCCCGLVIVELGSNGFEVPASIVYFSMDCFRFGRRTGGILLSSSLSHPKTINSSTVTYNTVSLALQSP